MIRIQDQIGNLIELDAPVKRIVSIVPSQTELLFDLGLGDRVVGVTKFCVHPSDARNRSTVVGGTKNIHLDKVAQLQPDLIIANKEENLKEQIEKCQEICRVWVSDINTLDDAYEMIEAVGLLTSTQDQTLKLVSKIKSRFSDMSGMDRIEKVLYLIWTEPWMAVGKDSFINSMMEAGGFQNAIQESRYPELSKEDLKSIDPNVVILSSEPYPFKERHAKEIKEIIPDSQVVFADGEIFSWYGSRLLKAPEYIKGLFKGLKYGFSQQ